LFTLKEHTHVVESVAFPPLGTEVKIGDELSASNTSTSTKTHTHTHTYLVSGSRDKTVKLWDATTGTCVLTFQEHDNWVRAVCFHPSGLYILSCSDDRSVRVYDIQKKRCIRTLSEAHTQFVTCLVQHVKLPYVVTGGVEREIKVWETR
jgi:platelet-activating factor acetylhydrolase IB subunit alpha